MINAILMMGVTGAILGLILGIADKVFYVKEDERTKTVSEMLPGYNCGGCGFAGCSGLADAIINKEVDNVGLCKPCKVEQRTKIAEYLANTPGADGSTLNVKVS